MENKGRLRVQKKKSFKRGNKNLLKSFVDYLQSDTFMYAPLLSPLPSDFRSPHTHTFPSAKVVELKKPMTQNKPFLEQVPDYIKSDDYMYAPMVGPPHSPQAEPLQYYGRIRMAVSTMRANQLTDNSGDVNQISENHLPQTALSDQHTRVHKETVKHTVYQTCHSNPASGKVTLNSQLTARCYNRNFWT